MQVRPAPSVLASAPSERRFEILHWLKDRILEGLRFTMARSRSYLRVAQEQDGSHQEIPLLADALAAVVEVSDLAETVDFRVIVLGGEKELQPQLREEIYNIGREAIVNALRHSGASKIEMELEYSPSQFRVVVRDDGCGISAEKVDRCRNGQRGLIRMSESAERMGGRLRLFSGVALGTEIELCVPWSSCARFVLD